MANPTAPDSGRQKAGSSVTRKEAMMGCYLEKQTGQCSVIRLAQLTGFHWAHSKERPKDFRSGLQKAARWGSMRALKTAEY